MGDEPDATLHGSCRCSAVRYEVTGPPHSKSICHCNLCKNSTGSLFSASWCFQDQQFKLTQGEAELRCYECKNGDSGKDTKVYFCGTCSSRIYVWTSWMPKGVIVPPGTLDECPEWKPDKEHFTKRRPAWLGEVEGASQHVG